MSGKAFEVRLCGTAPIANPGASTTYRQNHRGEHEHRLHTVEPLASLLQLKPNDCYDTSDNFPRNLRDYTTRVNRNDLDFSDYGLGGSPAPPTHACDEDTSWFDLLRLFRSDGNVGGLLSPDMTPIPNIHRRLQHLDEVTVEQQSSDRRTNPK